MTARLKRGEFGAITNSESVSEFNGETFADRLRTLIGEGSANAFARECAIGETSVRQYLHGGVPGLDKVIQIARAKNVRVEWLATGEGPRSTQQDTALPERRTHQEHEGGHVMEVLDPTQMGAGMVLVPRLSVEGSAGSGLIPLEEDVDGYVAFSVAYLKQIDVSPRHAHLVRLRGHSMVPTLMDRDLVIVDTSKTAILGEAIFALVFGEAVMIKRIEPQWDGSFRIMSDNKNGNYPDQVVPKASRDDLRIIGRVGGYLRDFWG